MTTPTRRGWREQVQPGIHRNHSVRCPRAADYRPKGACPPERCSWQLSVGHGKVTIKAKNLRQAAAERARLTAELSARRVIPGPHPAPLSLVTGRSRESEPLSAFALEYMRYLKKDGRAINTLRNVEDDLNGLILPELGQLPLCDAVFGAELMDQYRAELVSRMNCGEISYRAVCQALKTLRAMLALAYRWERLDSNPARRLKDPGMPSHLERACDRVLTLEQLNHLLEVSEEDACARSYLGIAVKLGPRRGESASLCWEQVDLRRGRITFCQQIIEVRPRRQEDGTLIRPTYRFLSATKGREVRTLWLPAAEVEALRRWQKESGRTTGWVWPGKPRERDPRWPERAVDGARSANSFNQLLGRWLERAGLWDRWECDASGRPIRDDAGNRVRTETAAPISVHGLRHTAASILLLQGRPVVVVSRMLGHASATITEQTYSRFIPDEQFEGIARTWDRIS